MDPPYRVFRPDRMETTYRYPGCRIIASSAVPPTRAVASGGTAPVTVARPRRICTGFPDRAVYSIVRWERISQGPDPTQSLLVFDGPSDARTALSELAYAKMVPFDYFPRHDDVPYGFSRSRAMP